MSGTHVEMRLRFVAHDLEEAEYIVQLLENASNGDEDLSDVIWTTDVLFTLDSPLVNGNTPPWIKEMPNG